jgi:hypothetical protein
LLNTAVANSPSAGRTLTVAVGGNLQNALDSAQPGDRIILACGVYTGTFVANAKRGGIAGGWITVTAANVPAEGVRASVAPSACRPVLRSPNPNAALTVAAGATRWRFVGLEITADSMKVTRSNSIVLLGDGDATSDAQLPRNIILDRSYVHGSSTMWVHRCVALNADSSAVIDSYVSECHADIDAQAVWGWNLNGPVKIAGNYLEASTEVTGFGGADPGIANSVPSDVEISRNHITRPLAWKGSRWLIKNLVEFKAGRRVLIDGNVLENSWPQGQHGEAFVLWSVNQQTKCTWCVLEHVTIRSNVIRNVAAGFMLTDIYRDNVARPTVPMHHVTIINNVLIGVSNDAIGAGGMGILVQKNIAFLRIEHNTMLMPPGGLAAFEWVSDTPIVGQRIANNLSGGGRYPLYVGPPRYTWASIAGPGTTFTGNVMAFADASAFPSGNLYPASYAALGLVGGASAATDINASLDALALAPTSPLKGRASDRKDPGADIAVVKSATAGVVAGAAQNQAAEPKRP